MADTFTAAQKYDALLREARMRRRVYPRRVADKRITQKFAEEQIALIEAVAADYKAMVEKERLL